MAKRAVLIGINKYQVPGADLRGCVNDVNNLKKVLTEYYGFAGKDITVLTDLKATKKAMQAAIQKLIHGSKKGDVLLLHYSGHGSNVPDDDGDEADKREEILCPTDLDWKDPFRDDWLRKTFDKLKAGVSLTVIMDCCHSGTITRAIQPPDEPVKQRYLPSPWDLVAAESGRTLRGTVTGGLRSSPPREAKEKRCGTCRHLRIVDYRMSGYPNLGRRLHQGHVQRRAHVLPGREHQGSEWQTQLPRAAQTDGRQAQRRI